MKSKRKHHRTTVTRSHVEFDGLRDFSPLGKRVSSTDVFVGAGLGLGLGAAVKYLLNRFGADKLPATVLAYAGPLSTLLAGVGLYLYGRRAHRGRAEGHLVGAMLAAATPIYWSALGKYGPKMDDGTPFFSDYVMTSYGLLTADGSQDSGYAEMAEEWDSMAP